MIPRDSPFRNPPDSLPPVQKVAIDGLRYAAEKIDLSSNRLYSHLSTISTGPETERVPPEVFTMCLTDAWSIVDNLWRLNLLLLRMPGLKRTSDVEAHLRALRAVEKFRHGLQHLDERIAACARDQLPLWGTLAWVFFPDGPTRSGRVFLMIPGSLRSGTHSFLNPAGEPITDIIDLVTLSAFGHKLELSFLVRRVSVLITGLDQGLRRATSGEQGSGADMVISAEYVPAPSDGSGEVV
ncbi:MAG: hypothetical protein HY649_04600 [Acidobacteria bacterium]|nr:hypothetical protein [Acidobacteriota bacterium]